MGRQAWAMLLYLIEGREKQRWGHAAGSVGWIVEGKKDPRKTTSGVDFDAAARKKTFADFEDGWMMLPSPTGGQSLRI